mmetsp:Transcript_164099/g.290583  ORF Transcript_164099/g.290583 Transcript_164099/m.290583 type:complete len:230 (+) Transcript_164099:546-1235(+)
MRGDHRSSHLWCSSHGSCHGCCASRGHGPHGTKLHRCRRWMSWLCKAWLPHASLGQKSMLRSQPMLWRQSIILAVMHNVVPYEDQLPALGARLQKYGTAEPPHLALLEEVHESSDVGHNATFVRQLSRMHTEDMCHHKRMSRHGVLAAYACHDCLMYLRGAASSHWRLRGMRRIHEAPRHLRLLMVKLNHSRRPHRQKPIVQACEALTKLLHAILTGGRQCLRVASGNT